nr:hypothetical protein CFP56_56258 [Quercus suber]
MHVPRQLRRAHRPQAVVGEVVGLEGVDAVEVLEVVMRMRMTSLFCTDDEALEGDWDMYMDGVGSSRCMSDAVAQPSHPAGHDYSAEHTSCAQASPRSPPPTRLSPPLFNGSAHDDGCKFVPTPG